MSWDEAAEILVDRSPQQIRARRDATFSAVAGWAKTVSAIFGDSDFLLGGNFMRFAASDDVCTVAVSPRDEGIARRASEFGVAATHLNIMSVLYSWPSPGGFLTERSAVGGCVDAYLTSRTTRPTYVQALAAVTDAAGRMQQGVTQGVLKVAISDD